MPLRALRNRQGSKARIRARVEGLIQKKFGRIEEELVGSGLLDSLRTIELALLLESEFSVPVESIALDDVVTVTRLVERLLELKPDLND